jgi:hypothetical protein
MKKILAITFVGFVFAACSSSKKAPVTAKPAVEPAAYNACEGKKAGDACTICAPDAKDCVETAEVKACDAEAKCSSAGSPVQ